ncbi:MAG: hypothetical protein AAF191_05365 [Verrucomicrobiota bacterium]
MARALEFVYRGKSFRCSLNKVDRTKIYGTVAVETLGPEGESCELVTLAADGKTLIPSGGTAFGYLNPEGEWLDRSSLIAVDEDGQTLQAVESNFNRPTELSWRVSPEEFLDVSIRLCYALKPTEEEGMDEDFLREMKEGAIFRTAFSYRGGINPDPAFLLEGVDGTIWLLIGAENEVAPIGLHQAGALESDEEEESSDSGDVDFGMM